MKSGRPRGTQEETGKSGDGGEEGDLAKITHKFSFPPQKFRNTAERENRHRKRAAD